MDLRFDCTVVVVWGEEVLKKLEEILYLKDL